MKASNIIIALLACGITASVAYLAALKTGIIYKYPEPFYLSANDEAKRPVYQQLDSNEKAVYASLLKGMQKQEEEIPLPYEISGYMYEKLYCLLEKQESDMFFLDSSYYTADKFRKATIIYRQKDYDYSKEINSLSEIRKNISDNLPQGDDYEKAMYIHDYIVNNCRYLEESDDTIYESTAYGCLVEGVANCEGYAKAFDLLASDAGLQSILVTGTTNDGKNHAWNQVNVNGNWYNIDVTWDDKEDGEIRWIYFLCDDDSFSRTHFKEVHYFTPFQCSENKDNFYVRSGLYAESAEQAKDIFLDKVEKGEKSVRLRFPDSYTYSDFKANYIDSQAIFGLIFSKDDTKTRNISISLTENVEEHCMTIELL